MKIEDAVKQAYKEGLAIRRASASTDVTICGWKSPDNSFLKTKNGRLYAPSLDDLIADDWEVVEHMARRDRQAKKEENSMTMKEWAKAHNLESLYDEYIEACEDIARECEAEGYPAHGSNYEIRVTELEKMYPELFGDDDEPVGYAIGYCGDEVIG